LEFLNWLQGATRAPRRGRGALYVLVSVVLPVLVGLAAGFGLRLIERVFGVELGKGGGH
jgi:hypothetical protein